MCSGHSYEYCPCSAHLSCGSPEQPELPKLPGRSEHSELRELHSPPSTARTFEIQVPATPREGGESAKRATDSPASQTRASKRAKAAPGQMNLKLLSRNSVRKARVEDAMDTDDDDIAASTQLTEDTNPFSNDVLLQLAYENGADVVCVQEPWSSPGTKTQNHPAYECYAPYDSWEAEEATEREAERPRTMSYIRRGAAVQAQQRRGERNRDVVWLEVNGHHIVNIYREPNTMAMINYTVGIVPGPRTLIGGDFNAKHDTYEPGVLSATQGATLANWSQDTGMDFIGEVGVPTHRAGHVIDLTFSNIPFAETVVRRDMDCGSDHFTQVTTIPGRGTPPNKRVGYRVTEDGLYTFASLIESGAYWLPKVMNIASDAELETATEQLTDLFQRAIRTAGRPATDRARSAPWWDSESASAYSLYKRSGRTLEDRKRMLSATRKAKREYWRRLIDNASDDADLYKVVGWHKAAPSLKFPPLVVDGQQIEGTREKAQILLDKVLHRYDSTDDLDTDPVSENRAPTLPWDTNVSLEEVERNTIGVSSTSPGADKVTVRLLKACWGSIKGQRPRTDHRKEDSLDVANAQHTEPSTLRGLPKRSAMDLVAAFVHDVECAFARKREVTLVTMDVQGAFDALLPRRLLKRMQDQGWPTSLLKMIRSFLQERRVMVRLENVYTDESRVQCGTPQGSPLSPVLYMLYLAELLNQDQALRFGYADDIALYRVGKTLEDNIQGDYARCSTDRGMGVG
ncbi:hypothetical protein DID88_009461 [Monilinia fructigena]|uniref:Reverse transcriptase domain-containing protein n=1 Tax=Monilinia fructigena TaxID=38457 RepID=A0A395IM23_9HELO|nr:hypothetical protein DID88_009461 [Monilinia fructigena]